MVPMYAATGVLNHLVIQSVVEVLHCVTKVGRHYIMACRLHVRGVDTRQGEAQQLQGTGI